MFDVGWSELVVIGVVALVVIGPKELPGVIRAVGRGVAKLRTMAGEFRGQFDDAMREAELHEVKKTFTDLSDTANSALQSATDPLNSIGDEMKGAVEDLKGSAAEAASQSEPSPTIAAIEADARAMEAEISAPEVTAPEPEPLPAKKRKAPTVERSET